MNEELHTSKEIPDMPRWHASNLPYRAILERMQLAVLEVDNEGIIRDVHEAFCKMTGYTREEMIGKDGTEFLLAEDEKDKMRKRLDDREAGKPEVYEIKLKHKDGHDIWFYISAYPIYNEKSEVVGSLGIHMDITYRKMLEKQLAYLNVHLESEVEKRTNEIRNLVRRLEGVQERERKLVASELHDDVGHSLLAMRMELEDIVKDMSDAADMHQVPEMTACQQMVSAKLAQALATCQEAIGKVRQISHYIFPPELQFGTLCDAFRARADYFTHRHNLPIRIECSENIVDPEPALKLMLYRTFQESVSNAIRHGKASFVLVRLVVTAEAWVLKIQNDCRNDISNLFSASKGIGQLSIQERISSWNGTISVINSHDGLYTVLITIPLHKL